MSDVIDWLGQSGKTYRYWFTDISQPLKDEGGNYMFVKQLLNGNFTPIYIGQADNFKNRLPNHDRLEDAKRAGATHTMTHTTPSGEQARLDEERDLILRWDPPLNTQHRKVS